MNALVRKGLVSEGKVMVGVFIKLDNKVALIC